MAINLDSLKGASNERTPISEGVHQCEITKAPIQVKNGKRQLNINMKCDGGMLFFNLISDDIPDFATYAVSKLLKAVGIPLEGELTLENIASMVVGKQILVRVKQRTYKNNSGENVISADADLYASDVFEAYAGAPVSDQTGAEIKDDDVPF